MVDKARFAEEDAEGYSIQVLGRSVYVTEAMKKHAWDKMSKVDHKVDRRGMGIMHVQIILDIQKLEHICTIVAKFKHFPLKVQAGSTDMYASIDKAIDRLQVQFRRWKGKIIDHSKKKLAEVDMAINVLRSPYSDLDEINSAIAERDKESEIEEFRAPKIVGEEKFSIKTLTVDEALMKIDLSGDPFLIYRDEAAGKVKLMYQRPDRNYGLVHIE